MRIITWKVVAPVVALALLMLCGTIFVFRASISDWMSLRAEAMQDRRDQTAFDSQTTQLPMVDRAEIFQLGEIAGEGNDGFPIRPYKKNAQILNSRSVIGGDAESLAKLWRRRGFGGGGALCHKPVYGMRLLHGGTLLLETSLCWECSNCFVKDGSGESQWIGGGHVLS